LNANRGGKLGLEPSKLKNVPKGSEVAGGSLEEAPTGEKISKNAELRRRRQKG